MGADDGQGAGGQQQMGSSVRAHYRNTLGKFYLVLYYLIIILFTLSILILF